jgi:hypothetical protein
MLEAAKTGYGWDMGDSDGLKALVPASIRPPFAAYSHGTHVPAGAEWVFTSGQLGIATDDTIPEARRRRPISASRRSMRSSQRPGSTGGYGADQRLRHRPGAYGRLHGVA